MSVETAKHCLSDRANRELEYIIYQREAIKHLAPVKTEKA